MSQPATAVLLSDPDDLGGTLDGAVVATMQQALAAWATHLDGLGTLTVQLDMSDTLDGAEEAQGGATIGLAEGTEDGRVLVALSSLNELATGAHVPGYASDVTVTVNAGFLAQLYLGDGATVPPDEIDGLTLFEHEVAHGLGFGGMTSSSGSLGGAETAWDHDLAIVDGAEVFTGANAEHVNGGPVAVTTLPNGEGYAHLANDAADPNANDLMTGLGLGDGVRRAISSLDLAILADVGAPITGIPGTVGIAGTLETVAPSTVGAAAAGTLSFAGIVLGDTGALSSSTVTLAASDPGGTLFFGGAAGVTVIAAADGHAFTLAGSLPAVQAGLAGLRDASTDGQVTLALVDSAGNAGSATLAVAPPPVLSGVQASADAAGPLDAGHAIALTLSFSGPVVLAGGTPVLTLSDGGTAGLAPGAATATSLRFTTTVAAGQNAADLAVTGLVLAGATLTDAVGNALVPALSAATPGASTGIVVDTTPPAAPTLALSGGVAGGTAEAGSTVALHDGQALLATAVSAADGTFTIPGTIPGTLAAGTHALAATATDAAGNVSPPSAVLAVTVPGDTQAVPAGAPAVQRLAGGSVAADPGADVMLAAAPADGLVQVTGNPAAGSSMTLFGQSGALAYANGGGSAIVVAAGASPLSLFGGAAGSTMVAFTGAAASTYAGGAGADELIAGGGLTVTGGSGGSLVVFGGAGPLVLTGGAERDTVVGGTGPATIHAGAGGAFAGTGGSELVALGAGGFLVGNVDGDRLAASAAGSDILAAGAGAETLDGGASGGANLLFGGTGADLVRLGAGADTFVGGPGGGTVQLGSGSATLFLGGGAATTLIGGGGGSDSVVGFRAGTDHLQLPGGTTTALAGGSMVVALTDGTRITLVGLKEAVLF